MSECNKVPTMAEKTLDQLDNRSHGLLGDYNANHLDVLSTARNTDVVLGIIKSN